MEPKSINSRFTSGITSYSLCDHRQNSLSAPQCSHVQAARQITQSQPNGAQSVKWAQGFQLLRTVATTAPPSAKCLVLSCLGSAHCRGFLNPGTPGNGGADSAVTKGVQAARSQVRIPTGGLQLTNQSGINAERPKEGARAQDAWVACVAPRTRLTPTKTGTWQGRDTFLLKRGLLYSRVA